MDSTATFSILDTVESTNNYAMAKVHEGMAKHGMAWFSAHQTAGKGQRGKQWFEQQGKNVALSVILQLGANFFAKPFLINALVAVSCHKYFADNCQLSFSLKWPNDLFFNDRKAGGILIENVIAGRTLKYTIAGIGLNVKRSTFASHNIIATSVEEITNKIYEPEWIARGLHQQLLADAAALENAAAEENLVSYFNDFLYRKGEQVKLKRGNAVFETTILDVNAFGELHTKDSIDRYFNFGEVSWI